MVSKVSSEGLSPDAVVGSGKRTRRLELDLERLTVLKVTPKRLKLGNTLPAV